MKVEIGDKIWMHYGPNVLIVGHIVDVSPDCEIIGISPVPYSEYKKMTYMEKASCPVSWCEIDCCHYLGHIAANDLDQQDASLQPQMGFFAKGAKTM